jgi:EAL domain-containing protein (putative c-di-GMP-specific phosphodiesterase class I)
LVQYAKNNNNSTVDTFIKNFAKILKTSNENFNFQITAYRFFGSEFAMLLENAKKEDVNKLIVYLKEAFEALGQSIELSDISNIGATPFNPIGTTPEMLVAANEARVTAKQVGPNEAFVRDENDLARDMEAWKDLVFDIIDNSKFHVGYIGDACLLNGNNAGQIVMQEAFTDAKDKSNQPIPIGTFISIAEKYEKIVDFDKAVVTRVINHINKKKISHSISVNLSLDSIVNIEFINWIKTTLTEHKEIAGQLVFSITAYGVAKDISQFKAFTQLTNEYGAKIIVKRFESKFIPLDSIKDLHIDYIRLARDYTNGINSDSGKYAFVESMQDLSNLLNIKVFAENVKSDDDLEKIKELNLYAASR